MAGHLVRTSVKPYHFCDVPSNLSGAKGNFGDIWRCDHCKKLWRL